MKKISRLLSILIMVMMIAAPFMSFATEEGTVVVPEENGAEATVTTYDDTDAVDEDAATADKDAETQELRELNDETTEVTVVDSVMELSKESDAEYDNDAFFTIDASKDKTADLATDEVSEDVSDVLSGGGSASKKQDAIIDVLEDSGYYRAEESGKSEIEVTSRFAYQRLRLVADQQEDINAYGAIKAVYFGDSYLLSYDSMEATKLAYEALASEYGSDSVFVDVPVRLNSSLKSWGTTYMRMDYEKTLPKYSGNVTVAVIDTGIMRSHEIFSGRTVLQGYDFVNSDNDPSDGQGHGTAVSGVIAESTPSNVKILPIKALDDNGRGSMFDIMFALEYANNNHADIINMSLGGYLDNDSDLSYYDEQLKGISSLIICASGNEGYNLDVQGVAEFPAELEKAVSVGAIDTDKERSYFSNYGSAVDFAAPGSGIMLASIDGNDEYGYMNGTSFSSPYVAAAAALAKSANTDLTNEGIVNYLVSIGEDLGAKGRDVYFGYGCPRFAGDSDYQRGGSISGEGVVTTISDIRSRTYNGYAQTQRPCVITNGEVLVQGTDYYVLYENNINAGTAYMTIIGKGDYYGEIKGLRFTIDPKRISPYISLSGTSFGYTGGAITPDVTVRDGSRILKNGTDYTVSCSGNVDPGTAYVTVTCRGNYRGSAAAAFEIRSQTPSTPPSPSPSLSDGNTDAAYAFAEAVDLAKVKISRPSAGKKKVTVRWKKPSKKNLNKTGGIEIRVTGPGYDSIFTAGKKKTSKKISGLKSGQKYTVRVRAYKYTGGVKHVSAWSGAKTVKIK